MNLMKIFAIGLLFNFFAISSHAQIVQTTIPAQAKAWVLLIPGAGSSGDRVYIHDVPNFAGSQYFGKLKDRLSDAGLDRLVCPETYDDDTRSLEEREEDCAQSILKHEGKTECKVGDARDVVIMGHSMGGLIARLLAQDQRVANCIRTVTMVSTPQQGTPIADFVIEHDHRFFLDFYTRVLHAIHYTPEDLHYFTELSTNRDAYPAQNFYAQDVPDAADVKYFSISTSVVHDYTDLTIETLRTILQGEIEKRGLDQTSYGSLNDGVVPEYSQFHGIYLGHLNVSHFESACIDLVKHNAGCKTAMDFIVPALVSQAQ
jgi:pimeloyl-ACP methyl ester carboxylesterase